MKQLANHYEAGNWSPFGEIGDNVGEDRPDEGDTRDKGPHAITATKEKNSHEKCVKKPSTERGKYNVYVKLNV